MHKTFSILALSAALLAGCAGQPKAPPVVYNPVDVIASGKPPLYFVVSRPGALNVIDVTTQSRIFHADLSQAVVSTKTITMRLDAESKTLAYVTADTTTTQPSELATPLLPIDPNHIYAVEFAPDFKTTPPATMPAK